MAPVIGVGRDEWWWAVAAESGYATMGFSTFPAKCRHFRSRRLVFDVDTRNSLLNEHPGETHDGGSAAMSGVCVSNDWAHVIYYIPDDERGIVDTRANLRFVRMSHAFFLFRVVVPRGCCQRNDKSLRDAAIATKQTPFPGKWPLENLKLEITRLLQVATSKY